MSTFDFPGGIGTASRAVGGTPSACCCSATSAIASASTCSAPRWSRRAYGSPPGSCIAVCATDAPLAPHQLRRLALRPLLGLARAGSYASEGSGEIGLAFSTAMRRDSDDGLDPYFAAAWEAAHEAVLNCLVAGRPAERLDGSMQERFPIELAERLARASDEHRLTARRGRRARRALIRLDTSNPPGNETPAAELLAEYLRAAGVECELVGPDPERLNLVARIEGRGGGASLMLMAHTDVVPAPSADWTVTRSRARSATGG